MKLLKTAILFWLVLSFSSCNDDEPTLLTINFKHYWDSSEVTSSDFNQLKYTNQHGELLSISKLRYLVSSLELHTTNGKVIALKDYTLIDITNNESLSFSVTIPSNTYSKISFIFGFNEVNNIDGEYNDLNATSWNWPEMLGGGYHFIQLEGKYIEGTLENPFAYHMGTAKVSDGVFEQNYFEVNLNGFDLKNDKDIFINMNIAEWFKNPTTWDLTKHNINLMPNYNVQKMMNENGKNVFSLSENPL